VLAIPLKKTTHPVLGYLTDIELAYLLGQVDRSTMTCERDYLFLALLYDTGARIQELLDLAPRDFRFAPPASVRLRGKGQRAPVPSAAANRTTRDVPLDRRSPSR
jgi:integrase